MGNGANLGSKHSSFLLPPSYAKTSNHPTTSNAPQHEIVRQTLRAILYPADEHDQFDREIWWPLGVRFTKPEERFR
jgi:hypothetical protein